MQIETPPIELYRVRTFTEKLTDTFNFLRDNWRSLLKYFLYLMLPTSIVVALPFNHFFEGYFKLITLAENPNAFSSSDAWLYGLSTVASIVLGLFSVILLQVFIFAMIRVYMRNPQRLKDIIYADFRDDLFFCFKRGCIESLVGVALAVVVALLFVAVIAIAFSVGAKFGAVISILGVIFLYVVLVIVLLPMMMVSPIYLLEDEIGVFAAYKKGFRLGFATWGGLFALLFVVGILSSVVQTVTMMPWYILSMVKMFFTLSNDMDKPFLHSFVFAFIQYLTCILMYLGYMLSEIFTLVAVTIQYGHASEKIDGKGVAQRIEKFDEFDNF